MAVEQFAAMVVDYVGFVLVENPWSMTTRELYVDYQPWISLFYLSILVSPWIRLRLSSWREAAAARRG